MRTIYTIILASGLYTDGQTITSTPVPMPQPDCITISQLRLDEAECVQVQWPYDPAVPNRHPRDAILSVSE